MQPWHFIRIRSREVRDIMYALVEQERLLTDRALGEREYGFMKLKVQCVLDAAEVRVVARLCRRRTLPEMGVASAACAI